MKKFLLKSVSQIIVWGIIAFVTGTTAIIFAGAVGGSGMGAAPAANFGMVERFVCPNGDKLLYEEGSESTYTDSDGLTHTGKNIRISCIAPDGTRTDKELQAIFSVLSLYFLICFVPLLLPGMLLSWIIIHLVFRRFSKKPENLAMS